MHRRLPSAMALGFILAAAAAAPASAAPATLDTSFGTNGYAVSAFGQGTGTTSAVTNVGPGGVIVSGALTQDFRRGISTEGLHVIQRSASGQQLDADFIEFGDSTAWLHDVRKLADGRVIAVGQTGEGTRLWIAIVDAQGTPGKILERDNPSGCSVVDAVVHPSGQIVAALNCEGTSTEIRVLEPGDFSDPNANTDNRLVTPTKLAEDVTDLALAPDGTVAVLAELAVMSGRRATEIEPDAKVGRLQIADGAWSLDDGFGEEGWTSVVGSQRVTVDGANRPVTAQYRISDDEYELSRVEPEGGLDDDFGTGGVSEVDAGPMYWLQALGTDERNRVLIAGQYYFNDDPQRRVEVEGVALARLTEGGDLDPEFGDGGRWVFGDSGARVSGMADPVAAADGAIATFTFGRPPSARAAVPAPDGAGSLVLAKVGVPKATDPPQNEQPPAQQGPTPVSTATSTTVASTAKKTARTCLSRRSFTIRLRPRQLRSATVTVAGKKVKTTRRNGRLTAKVDLRKLEQATFDVSVRGTTRKGRKVSETRTYRTCRVGENGRKVKGGSIIFTVGS